LPTKVREILLSGEHPLFVSAVNAWEFAELELRGRLPPGLTLTVATEGLGADVLELPADTWTVAATLPRHHKDPIDRMMIAHAILANLPIITSDATMRRYPVASFW
jgi:PIN domain nuclease of toxin-antitoxin system